MKINVREAKAQFSRLLQLVSAGQEITIVNRGVPVARPVPIACSERKRELGTDRGKVWIADDFDAPNREIEAMFGVKQR